MVETIGSVVLMLTGKGDNGTATIAMKIKIRRNGQITIPAILRLCLTALPGDDFEIELKGPGRLELRQLTKRYPWDSPALPSGSSSKKQVQ